MTIVDIRHARGVAGQHSYTVTVAYPGEPPTSATLVQVRDTGPIVLVTPSGLQTFVSRDVTDRIGSKLSPEWVRAFFGESS